MYLSKRNGTYYVFYENEAGKRTCISTKTKSKQEAYKFLANFEDNLKSRTESKTIPITLEKFRFEFLKQSELHNTPHTTRDYFRTFKALINYFGNVNLSELNEKRFGEFFNNRLEASSIYQVRKDRINLHCCMQYAIAQGYLQANPISKIKKFKPAEKQPVFFSETEIDTLLAVIDDYNIRDLAIFALNTGLRQMELISMTWEQVNFQNRCIILDNQRKITKSKKVRSIPLNLTAYQILAKRKQAAAIENVFTQRGAKIEVNYFQKSFKKYIRKAGINDRLHFHSLRHTFASWLVQRGIPVFQVKELLGHSDIKMTMIYAHLSPDNLMEAVNILDTVNRMPLNSHTCS